jgi:Tol biopolymer transport system component
MNLWSIAIDERTGAAFGPLRRLTRGPGIQHFLCTTSDGRYLFHGSGRASRLEILRRDLQSGEETSVPIDPAHAESSYPAISPSGRQLAYAPRSSGPHAARPVFVLDLVAHTTRLVCEDSGGRPREWIDERHLVVETFGARLTSILVLDTVTGERRPLVSSAALSLANPRVSPQGRWIAFDAALPGGSPSVFAAPIADLVAPPESSWRRVTTSASHPFWSRDGQFLYYLTTTPYLMLRGEVRARRFTAHLAPEGESIAVATLREAVVPAFMGGTGPVTAPDQIVFVLGDFRGDLWVRDRL